jgi:hypothetical protein
MMNDKTGRSSAALGMDHGHTIPLRIETGGKDEGTAPFKKRPRPRVIER